MGSHVCLDGGMPVSTYIALDRKIAGVRERVFLRGEESWSLKDHPVFAGPVNCHCPILCMLPPPSSAMGTTDTLVGFYTVT